MKRITLLSSGVHIVGVRSDGIARVELADANITVSTMYPFITETEFSTSLRGGHESAAKLEASHAPEPQMPGRVAEAILNLVRSYEG